MEEYLKTLACRALTLEQEQKCARSLRRYHVLRRMRGALIYLTDLRSHCRWHDAIRTLAKFHRVSPASVNLASFGKDTGFYDRQVSLFKGLCEKQANTRDVDTKEPVGKIPYFDDMVAFFEQKKTQPRDRGTFIHGDYKIDNLVFHKTEPRVIGILE